jgi:hypothetical protein
VDWTEGAGLRFRDESIPVLMEGHTNIHFLKAKCGHESWLFLVVVSCSCETGEHIHSPLTKEKFKAQRAAVWLQCAFSMSGTILW